MTALSFQPPLFSNFLLASLPEISLQRLRKHLQHTLLQPGQVLQHVHERIERCCFPDSGLISLAVPARNGDTVGVAVVGSDNMLGSAGALVDSTAVSEATVQVAGSGHWIVADVLRQQAADDDAVQKMLLGDMQNAYSQIAQLTLCQSQHTVTEQTCRWLLRLHFAAGNKSFPLPETFAGQMVNGDYLERLETLDALVRAGFISYEDGCVTIRDMQGLEGSVCNCHQTSMELQRRHYKLKIRYEQQRIEFLRMQQKWQNRPWKDRCDGQFQN
jgi:CRP-like cAMP-binding protein